jgi:hypothetical protein
MIKLDGTDNKGKLGANAILAVSMALCKVRGRVLAVSVCLVCACVCVCAVEGGECQRVVVAAVQPIAWCAPKSRHAPLHLKFEMHFGMSLNF